MAFLISWPCPLDSLGTAWCIKDWYQTWDAVWSHAGQLFLWMQCELCSSFRTPFTHTVGVTAVSGTGSWAPTAVSNFQPCLFPPVWKWCSVLSLRETVGLRAFLVEVASALLCNSFSTQSGTTFWDCCALFYHSNSWCARKHPKELFHPFLASSRYINCTLESSNKYESEMVSLYGFLAFICLPQCFS